MSSNQGFFGIFKKHHEEEPKPEPLPFAEESEHAEPKRLEPEHTELEQVESDFRDLEPEHDEDADFLAAAEEMSLAELESKKVKLPERKAYTSPPITMPAKTSAQHEQAISTSPASDPETSEIKQLELRAIFGIDRALTQDEILERAASLPGIQKVVIATGLDLSALNSLREWVSDLGFENAPVRIHVGSLPIEFIKHENVLLAVQLKGVFEPGVRETLMIVARELGRM